MHGGDNILRGNKSSQSLMCLSISLTMTTAEVQYAGHMSPVADLCWLGSTTAGSSPHMASCDASGSLHIWSTATGATRLILREPGGSTDRQSAQTGPTGMLQC